MTYLTRERAANTSGTTSNRSAQTWSFFKFALLFP